MISCDVCEEEKFPMDMHNKEICKVCWLKEYKVKFKNRTTTNIEKLNCYTEKIN